MSCTGERIMLISCLDFSNSTFQHQRSHKDFDASQFQSSSTEFPEKQGHIHPARTKHILNQLQYSLQIKIVEASA